MVQVHTLRDLEAAAPAEQTSAFPRQVHSLDAGPRPKCIDLILPGFRTNAFIFWISMVQIAVYVLCSFQSWDLMNWFPFSIASKGSSYGPPLVRGELWRLITPLFLHAGFVHILFNMFFQMRMGFRLEEDFGTQLFAGIYFICGLAGNLFSLALAPCKTAVGASTAGFGLIGIQMAQIALSWHLLQRKEEVTFNIIFFFMLALMMSVGPESVVDWRGHLGGFIAGFALGMLYHRTTSRPEWHHLAAPVAMAALGSLIFGSAIAIFGIPLSTRGCSV